MKKTILLFAGLFLLTFSLQAQILEEGFENGVPPTGWVRLQSGADLNNEWGAGTAQVFEGEFSAKILFNFSNQGLATDWLVTPLLDLTDAENTVLTFWETEDFAAFESDYSIMVSTTSQFAMGSFEVIASYSETVDGLEFGQRAIDLSDFEGEEIFIAFVMETELGDSWVIDNVFVGDSTTTCLPFYYDLTPVADCDNDQYTISFDVTELGSNTSVEVTDGTTTQTYTDTAISFGPYANGEMVQFTVTPDSDLCDSLTEEVAFICPPSNDLCTDAIEITCGDTLSNTTVGATGAWEVSCLGPIGNDGWFTFTSTGETVVATLTSLNDDVNMKLEVFETETGDCNDFDVNSGEDCFATGFISENPNNSTFNTTAGFTYFIRVASESINSPDVDYTLNIACIDCESPTYIETIVEDCDNDQFSVRYEFTVLGTSNEILVSNNQNDQTQTVTILDLVEFGPFDSGTQVEVTFDTGSEECDIVETVSFNCDVANDVCENATTLIVGGVFEDNDQVGNNENATDSDPNTEATECGDYDGGDVWFTAVVPASGTLTIEVQTVASSDFADGIVQVFTGDCDDLSQVACETGLTPVALTDLTAGDTVFVRVYEEGNDAFGEFNISAYDASLGFNDLQNADFRVYPNPATSVIYIENITVSKAQLFNVQGQRVLTHLNENAITLNHLKAGVYFLALTDEAGRTATTRIIKK